MRTGGPKDRPRFREIKRPDMPTNKPERVAPTKKRRHASLVTSSQGSCTGEIDLQEVCGRQASPVASPRNFSTGEANLRKLHQTILPFIATSLLESIVFDSMIFDSISLSLSSSSSEEDEPVILKRPQHTFPISGQEYTTWLLNGHPDVMREMLRVDAHTFRALVNLLVKRGHLKKWDHMRLSVEESLAIFLYICGHGKRQRCAAYQFRHSTTTISRHFKYMRRALCNVARSVIRPPDLNEIPPEILHDKKYYPWFENCVGAIGITGIEAGVPASDQATHRGRKVKIAQKVMAACSFDEKFTFVYAGWESYACDSQIFAAAVSNPRNMFPHPPANKYYLVDAGYTNLPGYLAPYHGEQKDDLKEVNTVYHSPKDLFNHKHSSLGNVIERCFNVLKARFHILKAMSNYNPMCQPRIVVACCVVHNLILILRGRDEFFKQIGEEVGHGNAKAGHNHVDSSGEAMDNIRNEIAGAMWEAYANANAN